MRRHERSPYTRVATDADKRIWSDVFAPIALVGFVPVVESGVTHWAAIVRNRGIRGKHVRYGLCNHSTNARPAPADEVDCMTCIVRIEKGPRAAR